MKLLLLLLLPAVAVGGELATYCTSQIQFDGQLRTVCYTQTPINTDLEITNKYFERQRQNYENQRRIQEDLDRRARDYDDTRSD